MTIDFTDTMTSLFNALSGPDSEIPSRLYHYCPVESFLGIVESSSIWLSNARATNDYEEQRYLYESTRKAINRMSNPDIVDLLQKLDFFLRATQSDAYIASFSTQPDDLNQWRAYARDGEGVSVEFDPKALSASRAMPSISLNPDHQVFLRRVAYGDPVELIGEIMSTLLRSKSAKETNNAEILISAIANVIKSMSPFFKSRHFRDEDEWRLVHFPWITVSESDRYNMKIDGAISRIQFRYNNRGIVPYFCRNFSDHKNYAIRNVVLGPKCMLNEGEIWMYLCLHGYRGFSTSRSAVPYR